MWKRSCNVVSEMVSEIKTIKLNSWERIWSKIVKAERTIIVDQVYINERFKGIF